MISDVIHNRNLNEVVSQKIVTCGNKLDSSWNQGMAAVIVLIERHNYNVKVI